MSISIRLEPEIEAAFRQRLALEGISLSAFVRDAIREKLARSAEYTTPYVLGETLFGRYASGETDRSQCRKEGVRERIHAKHRRR
ncbi:MAG: ribbon-helix-helix protein, CopG family [Gammaproteobacteria bacterium]|nr:ribbon-helix-helix protein, CopG family [Gammaproteobacteria bacterium]NNJ85226.1 ribbon-helix-helix protein, CopG family [Gammaproteobacteria bacterium]